MVLTLALPTSSHCKSMKPASTRYREIFGRCYVSRFQWAHVMESLFPQSAVFNYCSTVVRSVACSMFPQSQLFNLEDAEYSTHLPDTYRSLTVTWATLKDGYSRAVAEKKCLAPCPTVDLIKLLLLSAALWFALALRSCPLRKSPSPRTARRRSTCNFFLQSTGSKMA